MTSTKIKRTLSKFYGSGDETTEEIDDKNFDRFLVDKQLVSVNSSTKTCSPNTKNKMKNKSNSISDASVIKAFKEDIIDGFSILSFSAFDDLEDFLKNSKGKSLHGNYKENKISCEQKSKRQVNTSSHSNRPQIPVKIPESILKHEVDDSSSDATVEENVDDRMMESFLDASEGVSNEAGSDRRGSLEVPKVAVKRPPDEAEDPIESKKALWDNTEIKPNFDGMLHGPLQNICPGPEADQAKSSLKREFEDDDDYALIEGVTRREGNVRRSASTRVDIKPIIKSDSEVDTLGPTFSGTTTSTETKVEMATVKKESSLKRRSPTPDDVVLVLDDSSSHSGGTSWVRWYAGLVFGDGKALRNDSLLVGCARTDVRYDASRVKNKHKNLSGDKKSCSSGSRKTSSIGPLSSLSSSSKAGFSPRHRGRADSPRMSDRLPPFRPPAFVPPRLTPPIHTGGGFCLSMPTVVPPAGLGVTLPPQQPPMMMPGWGQFELLAAQMAANQEMLRVQQGLNDRFLQDGSGSLRTMPLLGTGINIPMAIPGLQPTLTLRTEMHQHQHLHHHQHVVPASPYAPLPTVPPPVHPMQTQMAPPMYFQPSANIFSSSIHTRPGLPTRGAFMPMADHRSNSLPASQLLAKFRDRDWKQSNGNGRPGFKGRWCSAHVQLAWRILMHCRGLKQQAEDASYGLKFNNSKSNEANLTYKPSTGRLGSPPPLRQGWVNNPLSMKTERAGQESVDLRMMDFARKERDTVLRINSGRGQVEDFTYSSLASGHFLHQPINAFNEKKDFLDSSMGPFNRNLAANDPTYFSKGPLNPFSSSLPPFLPLGEDLFRSQQDRKLMADKYSTASKDARLPSPESHRRNRTPSNPSLGSFPFFPPPGPNNSIQPNLHLSSLQSQRYGMSSVNKPPTKQELPLGYPNFHGGFAKPYPELIGSGLLPQMLDPSRRSPFLKHTDSGLAPPPSNHPHMWGSYPPGMYPPAVPSKPQEGTQSKSSMCLPVPPLLPPYR